MPIEEFPHSLRHTFSPARDTAALLKGWGKNWRAQERWTLDYFERFGDQTVRVSNYVTAPYQRGSDKHPTTLRQYLELLRHGTSSDPALNQDCYLAGWHFMRTVPALMEDIEVPECFRDNILDRVNSRLVNYDSISLFMGHQRVGSPLHTDSFAVSVWLANIVGRKTVRVVPPVDYENIKNGMDAFSDDFMRRMDRLGIPIFEAVLEAGDIIFIPPGHWHQVKNEGFTIAVSVNFVSKYHFLPFEQQLRSKVLGPYMKLLELKAEVLRGVSADELSKSSFGHFNIMQTDSMFLDYLQRQVDADRARLRAMSEDQAQTTDG